MSAHRTIHRITRRTLAAAFTAVVAGLFLTAGGPAAADPPAQNVDPCVQELAKAAEWPSNSSDDQRYFSDAYSSYLSRQPACSSGK
jgi:hypothetical protein